MRGVVFTGGRELEMMDFPDPTPGPDEVVVEMKASGMCGSDLHQYRRPKGQTRQATGFPQNPDPVIAGHEPCGVVAAVGPGVTDKEAKVGARVMVHHYQGCTQCNHCRSGWQQLCQEVPVKVYGSNSHGGHAKYLKVPANTLVPLADELIVLRRRGDLVRFRHRVQRAAADASLRQRHDRDLRPGTGRACRHAVRQGDGGAGDRARRQSAAAAARQGFRRGRGGGSRLERSGGGDQGPDPWALRRCVAGHVEQSGGAGERDPQHQGVGHDVLRRRRRRRARSTSARCCCAGR